MLHLTSNCTNWSPSLSLNIWRQRDMLVLYMLQTKKSLELNSNSFRLGCVGDVERKNPASSVSPEVWLRNVLLLLPHSCLLTCTTPRMKSMSCPTQESRGTTEHLWVQLQTVCVCFRLELKVLEVSIIDMIRRTYTVDDYREVSLPEQNVITPVLDLETNTQTMPSSTHSYEHFIILILDQYFFSNCSSLFIKRF